MSTVEGGIVVDSGQSVGDAGENGGQLCQHSSGELSKAECNVQSSGVGSNLTGSVINLTPNDIIAGPQILKLVSTSDDNLVSIDQASVQPELVGNIRGQNFLSQPQQLMANNQNGSKVHVISNVTLVSKSQATPQTINFVNTITKSINNSSANSGYINAFVSTKALPPSGKIVNLVNPIKGAAVNQQSTQKSIVQKVAVPRNVQVLTRVQTLTHATLGGNIIMSRLSSQQQQQFQPTPKQTTVKATTTGYGGVGVKTSKMITSGQQQQPMYQPGMKIYAGSAPGQKIAQGVKAVVSKAQGGQKSTTTGVVGPNKMVKQVYNSGSLTPTLTTITQQYPPANMAKSAGIHIQAPMNNTTAGIPVKLNSIQGVGQPTLGGAMVQNRTLSNYNNLVIQSAGGQKTMRSNKVIQVQHHNSTIQQSTQLPGNHIKMVQQNPSSVPSFNVIQGGTIKYVNAQGNVTQSPSTKMRPGAVVATPNAIYSPNLHQSNATYINNIADSTAISATVDVVATNATVDDMMYVNGMSMDEEISARILQSLSQKAVYNNNRYLQQQKYIVPSSNIVTDSSNAIQFQQQYTTSQYQSQIHDSKNGPEYFRVNTSDVQTANTTFIDNIPLVATNEDSYQNNQNCDQDDNTDGEELITSKDTKLIMQHPALQDHTYAAPMPEGVTTSQTETPINENFQTTTANSAETSLAHILMGYSCNQQRQDDDNNSVISNDSRSGKNPLDNDLGEETETAPEGEGEDDSVTRCICDLTHDDGYMICCDKCSAWQHVDCMGIDRQNIPDEYNCEMCQPRSVDKNRARSLQLIKRKEQQALMLLNTLPQQQNLMTDNVHMVSTPVMDPQQHRSALTLASLSPTSKKQRSLSKGKKGDGLTKRQKREGGGSRANGKRKETKKTSKRKSKQQQSAENGSVDKGVVNLRTWIENYEQAVTNHYSPELRARLQALGKQNTHQQLNCPSYNLKNVGNLEGKCGTVPHAGGKILISSLEMSPNTPIVEIRGKYMLSGQYKQQLVSSSSSTRNYGNTRNPGPFIFFYRLPNDGPEICVDTRTYGNDARFVRRSCRPNAEVVHVIEKGTIHLYIVSMLSIKESTEITIRHEPHDLIGIGQGSVTAPTSTICACGLTKDCLFPNSTTPPAGGKVSAKRVNGNYHAKKEGGYKRSKSSMSRNRSTSSSGESNVGLLSPNGQIFLPNQISATALAPPSIQPQLLEAAAAALSSPQAALPPTVTQMLNQYPTSPTINQLNLSTTSSATTMSIPGTPTLLSPNNEITVVPKEIYTVNVLSPIHVPPNQPESPVKAPIAPPPLPPPPPIPTILSPNPPEIPPTPQPVATPTAVPCSIPKVTAVKRSSKQRTTSHSNDDGAAEVKQPPQVKVVEDKSGGAKEVTTEARKLTREERKMEAIMKAFEKMEKTSQRKQELKQQKSTGSGSSVGSGAVSRRRNSLSAFGSGVRPKEEDDKKTVNNHQKKKKRKGSKSYQQGGSSQKKRRRSRVNSDNDSDNMTSEESTALASPPLRRSSMYRSPEKTKTGGRPHDGSTAGMLLTMSHQPTGSAKRSVSLTENLHISTDTGVPTSFHNSPLSSVCMLVEAAVAPLENQCAASDFKLPPKTKTKKTIMNDWLNQSDSMGYSAPSPDLYGRASTDKNLDALVQAASVHGTQHYRGLHQMQEEPQNLSIMAKKVEEFITLTDPNSLVPIVSSSTHDDDLTRCVQHTEETTVLRVAPPLPTPPSTGGSESAVKKRWLRQAISEECTDEMIPSPPNGFMTPLKKRRLARQCSDLQPEDLSPTQSNFFPLTPQTDDTVKLEDGVGEIDVKNEEIKAEIIPQALGEIAVDAPGSIEIKEEPERKEYPIKRLDFQEQVLNEITMMDQSVSEIKEEVKEELKEQLKEDLKGDLKEVKDEIEPESFDIEPLDPTKTEVECKEEPDKPTNTDEMADIEQKIHSFHAENIMILKSRNKKAKTREDDEEYCDEKSVVRKVRRKKQKSKVKVMTKSSPEITDKVEKKEERIPPPAPILTATDLSLESPAVFPPGIPAAPSVASYSSYLLNNASNLMMNTPPPPPSLSFPLTLFGKCPPPPPRITAEDFQRTPILDMRIPSNPPPPPPLSEYLENPRVFTDVYNSVTLPTTPGSGMSSHPGYLTSLNTSTPQPIPPPTIVPPPVTPVGFLSQPSFSSLDPIPVPATPTQTPRVYTRTASADPRLNPNISVPEPTPVPKRKLSITEYRKRKQKPTDSSCDMKTSSPEADDCRDQDSDVVKSDESSVFLADSKDDSNSSSIKTSSSPEETVPFSPTPTLLELQQESLAERLKSYKSLQELTSSQIACEITDDMTTSADTAAVVVATAGVEDSPKVSSTTCDAVISSSVVVSTTTATETKADEENDPEVSRDENNQEITTTSCENSEIIEEISPQQQERVNDEVKET
ncbi:hypothetical protein DMENIID0001_153850 [Sergentomyia squamirostris]